MLKHLLAGLAIMLPAAAAAQYEAPVNPPEPAAHIAEMAALYDEICLAAFPDADAVARAVAGRGATPLSHEEVVAYLHDDPGRGWRIAGTTARFDVTIEDPPYHACGVRTLTAAGFPDMAPYRAVADRYESGKGFRRVDPVTMDVGNVTTTGGGDQRRTGSGGEALLVFLTTPAQGHRDDGRTAVEVRFVHQFAQR